MFRPSFPAAVRRLLRGLTQDLRAGRLLSEAPYNVRFCPCCEGDPRLRRCDTHVPTSARGDRR